MASLPPFDAPRSPEMPQDPANYTADVGDARIVRRGNGATVDFAPGSSRVSRDDSMEHAANLASVMEVHEKTALAQKIIEYVDADAASRTDWQQRMDQGMELLGLRGVPLENLPFNGASSVTYPLIAEAVVQFQARAIEEIFPSDGPVKATVVGKITTEKTEQAERVRDHMNYQMLFQDRSYFWHTDNMLFFLPIGGSAFKKTYFDPVAKMTVGRFVKSQDFIVPYTAVDLASSPRYTHRMVKSDNEMKKLFASGFYEEVDLLKTPYGSEPTDGIQQLEDQADSRTQSTHFDDTMNTLYECHIDLELESDPLYGQAPVPLPYIVTVLKENQAVVGVRRNWKEEDPLFIKRIWFTHYRYLPGFGFYGFGLLHLIGSIAEATSGSIRALLDSAMFANMQGGYASSDVKFKPGEERITPGVYKQVNMSAEELSKSFYTPPFKDPSGALASLTEKLIDAGKSFTSTTEAMTGEGPTTGPVGTTIAIIEQGSKVFSGIHRRLHMAAAEEFALRAELNYENLDDQYPYEIEGSDQMILRSDYDGRVDVIPVSDPNIFSTAQRIAQGQALVELSSQAPDLYDRRAVHMRFLKAIKIADPDELMQSTEQAKRMDPVTENSFLLVGRPIKAFLDQDHESHIKVHMNFSQGLNDTGREMAGPILQSHLAEHFSMKYWTLMNRAAGGQLPPLDLYGENQEEAGEMPPEADAAIAQFAATQPPVEIMPPEPNQQSMEQQAFEAEQLRLDEGHMAQMLRDQEVHEADEERKDAELMAKAQREQAATFAKVDQSQQVTDAKVEDSKKLGKEKVKVAQAQSDAKVREAQEVAKVKVATARQMAKDRVAASKAKAQPKAKPSGKR